LRSPLPEANYIKEARAIFAVRFPGGNFDDSSWDIRHLRKSQHKKTNARVYFTTYGSIVEPLPARFADIVKAFLLLMGSSGGTMPLRVDAARMLWTAIEKKLGKSNFSWLDVCDQDLLDTEQEMLLHWGAAATNKRCTMLQRMVDTLASAPYVPLAPQDQEALRQYVLGNADLPKNMALIISVDSLPTVWQAMIQPYPAEPLQGFKHYLFYIPGILFQLIIGDGAQDAYPISFNGNSGHPIIMRDVSHMMRNTAREQTAGAKRTQKLEQLTAELDAKGLSIRLGD
jgi:hypothetical protein